MVKLGKWIVTFMIIGLMMGGLHGTVNATSFTTDTRYSANDLRYLTAIIYCEARGESYAGKKAVGIVVMNRVESELFPNDVEEVIYQSGQFSPVASGRYALRLEQGVNNTCMQAAQEVLNGNITNSCLYFRTVIDGLEGTIIGHHIFY